MPEGSRGSPRAPWLVVALVGVVATWFVAVSDGWFLSPDEMANATFARQVATTGSLAIPAPAPDLVGVVAPRLTVLGPNGSLVPASFVTFPFLLGSLGALLGAGVIPFLPLVLFVGSVVAVARIADWYFGARAARLATLLYVVHPVVLFYASRTLWHNGSFLWLLLLGWAALTEGARRASRGWVAAGALLGSLAIAIRPSEVGWVLVFAAGVLVSLRPLPRRAWVAIAIAPLLVLALLLWQQAVTYGSPVSVGYGSGPLPGVTPAARALSLIDRARQLVFPFGLRPARALGLAGAFLTRWAAIPTVLGLVGVIVSLRSAVGRRRPIAVGALFATLWLLLYYGSSEFSETFTRSQVGLGSSYLRYWLPALALLTLFAPTGLAWLRARGVLGRRGAGALLVATITLGLQAWIVDPEFGLVKAARRDLADLAAIRRDVLAAVPPDAVIAAGALDKALAPERSVIGYAPLSQAQADAFVTVVQRGRPLYLVSTSAADIRRAEQTLERSGHRLEYLRTLSGGHRLYRSVGGSEEGR